jgi:hypothetical protein
MFGDLHLGVIIRRTYDKVRRIKIHDRNQDEKKVLIRINQMSTHY